MVSIRYEPYSTSGGSAEPGRELAHAIGDKLYFDSSLTSPLPAQQLYVYDTSTHQGWQNEDIRYVLSGVGNDGTIVIGDNLIFEASTHIARTIPVVLRELVDYSSTRNQIILLGNLMIVPYLDTATLEPI